MSLLKEFDPEIYQAIYQETERQATTLELIASENFVSEAVLEAMGSPLTNKYAEGYPGRRYYGGCEFVDIGERLAIERAKELFKCDHVNAQPHSGSQANMAVYMAEMEPGDTMLAMNLDHGGHLSHGSPVNFSGRLYQVVPYGVRQDTEQIDYDQVRVKARESRPKMIVVGASAYPRIIDFEPFREVADEVGAKVVVDIAHIAGLVVAGEHPSPVPLAEYVTTTTHKTLRGPRGGLIMCRDEFDKKVNSRIFPGIQGGPLQHVIAAKAVAFKEALQPDFADYQRQIVKNCRALADGLIERGLRLVSGGTDTHLLLVDLRPRGLTGKVAEKALGNAGITVNKNMIPFDPQKPFVTSGIRVGTPAVTTRGMKEAEMKMIAGWMADVLAEVEDEKVQRRVEGQVAELCRRFPLYARRLEEA